MIIPVAPFMLGHDQVGLAGRVDSFMTWIAVEQNHHVGVLLEEPDWRGSDIISRLVAAPTRPHG